MLSPAPESTAEASATRGSVPVVYSSRFGIPSPSASAVAALVTERGTAAEVIANMVREAEALAGRSLGELAELNSRRARV